MTASELSEQLLGIVQKTKQLRRAVFLAADDLEHGDPAFLSYDGIRNELDNILGCARRALGEATKLGVSHNDGSSAG